MSKDIAKSLGLVPLEDNKDLDVPQSVGIQPNEDYDLKTARDSTHRIIEKGEEALDEMIEVAKAGQSARGFEVVATLMKAVLEANRDLVDHNFKRRELQKPTEDGPRTINNNLIVSDTSTIIRKLRGEKTDESS